MVEAMYLMMRQAFTLGYRRYEWKCDALNAPSRAAAARLGLSFEGVFRQAVVVEGRNRDPANFDAEGRQRVRLTTLTAPVLAAGASASSEPSSASS